MCSKRPPTPAAPRPRPRTAATTQRESDRFPLCRHAGENPQPRGNQPAPTVPSRQSSQPRLVGRTPHRFTQTRQPANNKISRLSARCAIVCIRGAKRGEARQQRSPRVLDDRLISLRVLIAVQISAEESPELQL